MMDVAGIDVGAGAAKAVILREGRCHQFYDE